MSLTDFLFQGSPPPSVTTYGSTTSSLPPWFESYQQALLGKANAVAGEPWQQYQLPTPESFKSVTDARLAGFNKDTQTGWDMGRDAATAYQPGLNAATSAVQGAVDAPGGLDTANPYIKAGALSWPSQAGNYMNPFTEQVASRLVDVSNRNLFENILPNVNDNFVRQGMFGSSSHGDLTGRAMRDQNESLMGALSNTYSSAYNQGAQQFSADASRQLQAGNLAGTMANLDKTTQGALGMDLASLGEKAQRLGLTGAGIYEGIGEQKKAQEQKGLDINYQNFLDQRDWPKTQTEFMNAMIRGLQAPTSTSTTSTGPSNNYNAPPFAQLLGAGLTLSSLFGKAEGGRVGYLSGGRVRRQRRRYARGAS